MLFGSLDMAAHFGACGRSKRPAAAVASTLDEGRAAGKLTVTDGTELTSNAILKWCGEARVEWHHIAPGKPMQNGFIETPHELDLINAAMFTRYGKDVPGANGR